MTGFPYVWRWRRFRPWPDAPYVPHPFANRVGQRCRVLVRGTAMNSAAIEFDDGHQAVVSRYALRKAPT